MLVREGELVTVQLVRNGIEIRVLAKALESGSFGQVIRATSDATGQEIQVAMTAPQVGRLVQPELAPPSQASGRD
jgi:flagella basal body P-ring formation protein FlgA